MKSKRKVEYSLIDASDEVKRLNRVIGQVEGIQKMLSEGRKLQDILIQCRAIHSAVKSVEHRVFKAYVEVALEEVVKLDKKKSRAEKVAELEDLFKRVE
ncbi:MAG: metal-sensitive transcriptional regulator [Alphaproteobacteria bacterium]|jgi:DNA-binding FrmR family transcriptional regulator